MSQTNIPPWLKMIVGVVGGGIIVFKAPLVEIFTLFFYIVLIPVALFACVFLAGSGAYESFASAFNATSQTLYSKIREAMAGAKEERWERERTDEVPRPRPAQHRPPDRKPMNQPKRGTDPYYDLVE